MDLIKNLVDFVDNKPFLLASKSKHIKSDYFNYFFFLATTTKNFSLHFGYLSKFSFKCKSHIIVSYTYNFYNFTAP